MSKSASSRGYGPAQHNSWMKNRLYFDGDQRKFELWHVKFMGYLKLRGLKDIVDPPTSNVASSTTAAVVATTGQTTGGDADGGTPTTTGTTTPAVVDTSDKNAEVYAELIQFLDDRSLSLVMRDAPDDGKKAMGILREHYMGKGKPRVVTLWTQLTTLVRGPSEDVTDYIIRAENSVAALRNAGEVVSDSLLIAMVLKGLPSAFKPFEVVVTQNHDVLTFSDFKIALRNYEDSTENARITRENDADSVKHLHHRRSGGGGGPQGFPPRSGGNHDKHDSGGGGVVCHTCGKPGHKSPSCNKKNKKWCKICQNGSHYTKNCRNKNQNNDQQNKSSANRMEGHQHSFQFVMKSIDNSETVNNNDDNAVVLENSEVKTSNTDAVDTDDTVVLENSEVKTNDTVAIHDSHESEMKPCKSNDLDVNSSVSSDDQDPDSTYLVDSGATRHSTFDDDKFISVDQDFKPHQHTIELADGTKTTGMALKKGTIEISLKNSDGEIVTGTLDDVLHVPSFPQNIFSVKAALKKKSSVHFNCDEPSYLQTNDGTVFHLEELDSGLSYLRDYSPRVPRTSVNSVTSECEDDKLCVSRSVEQWHQVFGHCNQNDLLKLPDVVDGMKVTGGAKIVNCEVCQLGKMCQDFSRTPDARSTVPLEFVHTDLSGKIDPVSIDGHKYTI